MAQCYQNSFRLPRNFSRLMEVHLTVGEITPGSRALPLRQADRHLGLTEAVAKALSDPRRQRNCIHDMQALVCQRLYAAALGYEALNDHDELRREVWLQTAVERDRPLASPNVARVTRCGHFFGRSMNGAREFLAKRGATVDLRGG